jgi:peptide-methionine (S)-S-oxide reductase
MYRRYVMLMFLQMISSALVFGGGVVDSGEENGYQEATFAGGCFWCLEHPYDKIDGVAETIVGYTGGHTDHPNYEQVSAGKTGHAEAIRIVFDPSRVSYNTLLDVFWKNIDPTVKDKQFCDHGNQYRSAIFYHTPEQKKLAEESKQALAERFNTIYTEIEPVSTFYPAEEYHQDYYRKNPLRYKFYRYSCGRDKRLKELWGQYTDRD